MGGGYAEDADKPQVETDQEAAVQKEDKEDQKELKDMKDTKEETVQNEVNDTPDEEGFDQFEARQNKLDQAKTKPVEDVLNNLDDFPPAEQGTLLNIALKNAETPAAFNQFAEQQESSPELQQQLAGSREQLMDALNGKYL